MELLAFILISFGFIAIPGPNVLVVVSVCLSHGKKRGLQAVSGISLAMAVQLCIAATGTTWFVSALTQGFLWLKWIGVAYLFYIGISHFIVAFSRCGKNIEMTGYESFQQGFWVSLTNPKTILFFSAFLPQFVDPSFPYATQMILLSGIFWLIAAFVNLSYALLSSSLFAWFQDQAFVKYQKTVSGLIYVVAGAALAVSKKSN